MLLYRLLTGCAEIWLFIDGNRYKGYHNELGDFSFARY